MKVKDLLTSEDKWAKNGFAFNDKNVQVATLAPDAVRWCILGAIGKCYGASEDMYDAIRSYLSVDNVATWNDNPKTTFADVRKLVETLDI